MSDSDCVASYALARARLPADAIVTMLHIGSKESVVASGRADELPSIIRIGVGSTETGRGAIRHDPPTPLELENAIAAIEDEVMPLAKRVPRSSALVAVGGAIHDVALAAGKSGNGEISLPLADVEQLFQQLAAVSQGRPASSSGLPSGIAFAATLLILREFMHHLGFEAVAIGAGDPGLVSP
jgi:exopolyphosphatase/pppGpp-phosphohydrolase